ncbi:MAG: SIS domain-containing protein [Patescibacteria group bacterium]
MSSKKLKLETLNQYLKGTETGKNFLLINKIGSETVNINLSKYRKINFKKAPFYFVGSGSSFSVALFARNLFSHYTNIPCFAYTVYDYLNFAKSGGTVFIISQSGSTPDVLSAISWAQKMNSQIFAVSSASPDNKNNNLFKFLKVDQVFNINCRIEDAFINSVSPLVSCLIFIEILNFYKKGIFNNFLKNKNIFQYLFNNSLKKFAALKFMDPNGKHFICLGSGLSGAAVNELDLKINEAILEDSEKSELKDYTHGRFLKTLIYPKKNYFFIFLGSNRDKKLINFLKLKLKHPNLLVIRNLKNPALNSWQLFFDVLMVAAFLSFCKNKTTNSGEVFDPALFKIPAASRNINIGFNLIKNKRRSTKNPIIII